MRIDSLVVRVSGAEIETGNTKDALALLRKLLKTEVALRARGRLILTIDGYSDDARELYAIPEIREWMRDLDRDFPYWLFFMDIGPRSTLAFVALAICSYERMPDGSFIPEPELKSFLLTHFAAMNELADGLNVTQRELDNWSQEIGHFFGTPA